MEHHKALYIQEEGKEKEEKEILDKFQIFMEIFSIFIRNGLPNPYTDLT